MMTLVEPSGPAQRRQLGTALRRPAHHFSGLIISLTGSGLLLAGCAASGPGTAQRADAGVRSLPPNTARQSDSRQPSHQRRRTKRGGYAKIGKPYQIKGIWYTPRHQPDYNETGLASFYADDFHGKATANGETFNMHAVTAAHKTLPMPSYVLVENLENGRRLTVRVNDRGPFVKGRIIDLSRRSAELLGLRQAGLARVRVRYLGPAPVGG